MTGTKTIDVLRRFWWLVIAFVLAGVVVGGLPAPEQAADTVVRWSASHTILVSSSSDAVLGYTDPRQFNQLTLFTVSGQVPLRAAEELKYAGSPAALAATITVEADEQTGAIRISTIQDTSDGAVEVANAFADELISYLAERQDSLRQDRLATTLVRLQGLENQIDDGETQLRRDPENRVIQSELDALGREYSAIFQQFNALQADQTQLVLTTLERAQAIAIADRGLSAPRSRVTRGIMGAFVGGILGIGLATLFARTDRRLRTREQVEQIIGLPTHALIPLVDKQNADQVAVVPDRHDPLSDSYRRLRSIVSFLGGADESDTPRGRVTLVVSAGPGDGKTSLSANLIAAYNETGARTIGVNTDFRRPSLLKKLQIVPSDIVGLTLDAVRDAPLNLVTTPTDFNNLVMLDLSTIRDHSPGELARATAHLLPRISAVADAVIIDTSPVAATAEVLEFLPIVDNVIVVVRLGHTSIKTAERTIETVRALSSGNILLALIGGSAADSNTYYYQYNAGSPSGRFRRRKPKGSPVPV